MKYLKLYENIDFEDWDEEEDDPFEYDVNNFIILYYSWRREDYLCYRINKSYFGAKENEYFLWNVDKKIPRLECLTSVKDNDSLYKPATEEEIIKRLNKNKLDYLLKHDAREDLKPDTLDSKSFNESVNIDPFQEEDWEEESTDTVDDIIDNHLVDYQVSLDWGYENTNKKIIEKFVKEYRLVMQDDWDKFYKKWKKHFKWISKNYGKKQTYYVRKDDTTPSLKINFEFDDDSYVYMYFNPITLKHVGGLHRDPTYNGGNSVAYKMYRLMEPTSYQPLIRDHKYNFDYFKEKLNIDLDV